MSGRITRQQDVLNITSTFSVERCLHIIDQHQGCFSEEIEAQISRSIFHIAASRNNQTRAGRLVHQHHLQIIRAITAGLIRALQILEEQERPYTIGGILVYDRQRSQQQ